jgi:hypothetical protein
MLQSLNMVHFHFTFKLENNSITKWISISQCEPLDDFKDPWIFHGRGSWSECKAATNFIGEELLTAHVVAHTGFSSPLSNFPPPTLPDSSKPLQQFIHVMTASGIGLIQE